MWREILYSFIGHVLILSGLVIPSFLETIPQTRLSVYPVKYVTPESIDQLLKKSAPSGVPKPKIPQVTLKPDQNLPDKTSRPKQPVKGTSVTTESSSAATGTGEKSNKEQFSGMKLDSEFEYPGYLIEMRDRIERNWKPPTLRESLKTRVYFKLGRDGVIVRSFVEERTGNVTFDMAAMNAVLNSAPFPPLPEEFTGKELGVHFDFIYEQ